MLLKDSEAIERINSPLNLLNRLRNNNKSKGGMSLFIPSEKSSAKQEAPFNPFEKSPEAIIPEVVKEEDKPELQNLIDGADSKIKLASAHNKALTVLTSAIDAMQLKIDDIKPEKLPQVIAAASKVVESIRKERNEDARNKNNQAVHFHFYTPQQKAIQDYEVVETG